MTSYVPGGSMDLLDRIAGIPPPTTWKTVVASIFYYGTLPAVAAATTILNIVLVVSSPLTHLVSYVTHALLIPLSLFGKLETFYIYFGVASLVGLLAGSIVYSISRVLVSVLGLKVPISQKAPHRIHKSQDRRQGGLRKLGDTASKGGVVTSFEEVPWYGEPLTRENVRYLDRDRKGKGISSQVILEEDSEESDT